MQLPSILQGELLTRLLQGAAAGAVAIMFVGSVRARTMLLTITHSDF